MESKEQRIKIVEDTLEMLAARSVPDQPVRDWTPFSGEAPVQAAGVSS